MVFYFLCLSSLRCTLIRNTRRIIALLMFLNGFALERKYLTRSQNCSRAHTTGMHVLIDSLSINVRGEKQLNIKIFDIQAAPKTRFKLMVPPNMPTIGQIFD